MSLSGLHMPNTWPWMLRCQPTTLPLAASWICFSADLPTDVIVTWAPLPTIAAAWSTTSELSTPTVMSAWSASWPLVSSMTASCACAASAKACVAPKARAFSRLNATGSTTMTYAAPAYRAPCTAFVPTPPAPKITTVWPPRPPAASPAVPQPVGTPQPVSAATSNGMSCSIRTQEFCETTDRSANVPSMQKPPRSAPSSSWNLNVPSASIPVIICAPQSHRFWRPVEQYRQVPQAGVNEQTTWSPALTRVTSGPTASITPAPSCPPTIGSRPVESPVWMCSSEWHMPEAMNLIRTSPALGSSSSSSVTSHGLPGSLMIAALVRIPQCYSRAQARATGRLHCGSARRLW